MGYFTDGFQGFPAQRDECDQFFLFDSHVPLKEGYTEPEYLTCHEQIMRYLIIIFVIVAVVTLAAFYSYLTGKPQPFQDVALEVNGHPLSQKQVDDQAAKQGYHGMERGEKVASMVSREILLQEAQRQGIDRESSFREALKQYYEQSLIKVMMDRKVASVTVTVDERDVDRYVAGFGKIYTFIETPVEQGKVVTAREKSHTLPFEGLSDSLRIMLTSLEPGQQITQYETGTEVSNIRLEKVEFNTTPVPPKFDRARIKEQLTNYKTGREVDLWMHGLYEKASVVVYDKEKADE